MLDLRYELALAFCLQCLACVLLLARWQWPVLKQLRALLPWCFSPYHSLNVVGELGTE